MSFDLSGFDTLVVVWAALAAPVLIYSLVGTDHVGRIGGNPPGPRMAARWGWVVMELPALAFALWTAANLIPRALWRHRWYRRTFPDYPPSRRAVIPGVL